MQKKHQILKSWLKFAVLLYAIICIFSCNDNISITSPEEPTGIPDSSFFEWDYKEINGYILYDIAVYDTNKIYLLTPKGLIYYDGNTFTPFSVIDTVFWASSFYVVDPNNIYVGGDDQSIQTRNSKLRKWDGNNFSDISLPQDSSMGIDDIFAKSLNDIWLATGYGKKVYHYDGISIATYNLQSRTTLPKILLDSNNDLYLFGAEPTGSNTGIYFVYKFIGDNWTVYSSESYNSETGAGDFATVLGNNIVRTSNDYLVKFNFVNAAWERLDTTNLPSVRITAGGNSIHNIMCYAYNPVNYNHEVYLFTGEKWYKQGNYTGYGSSLYRIKNKYNNFYSFYDDPFSHLVIARYK